MVSPLILSAACCTTDPASVTGPVAPASGIEMSSAGTPPRANVTRLYAAKSVQFSGGEGQTSNTARGFSLSAAELPESAISKSIIACSVGPLNAPVTMGFAGVPQDQVAIEVADFRGDIVADERRGLSGVLGQHLRHLDEGDEVCGLREARAQGVGIEHIQAGRRLHSEQPCGRRDRRERTPGERIRGHA